MKHHPLTGTHHAQNDAKQKTDVCTFKAPISTSKESTSFNQLTHSLTHSLSGCDADLVALFRPLEDEFIAPPPFPLHSSMRVVLLVRGRGLTGHTPYW